MKFPARTLLLAPVPMKDTPLWAFPEITLRASGVTPPMRWPADSTRTPLLPLPRRSTPVQSVPIQLPATVWPAPPERNTPFCALPEITLRAPGVAPPMILLAPPATFTPLNPLPSTFVPVTSRPRQFPATTFATEFESITTPLWPLPEMRLRASKLVPPMTLSWPSVSPTPE